MFSTPGSAFRALRQATAGAFTMAVLFILGGALLAQIIDGSQTFWEDARHAAGMVLGIGGLCLFFLGISDLGRAIDGWEYIDNDTGSVRRTDTDRWIQAGRGLYFACVGFGMLTIMVKYLV